MIPYKEVSIWTDRTTIPTWFNKSTLLIELLLALSLAACLIQNVAMYCKIKVQVAD